MTADDVATIEAHMPQIAQALLGFELIWLSHASILMTLWMFLLVTAWVARLVF
jgi:hypothetical protein